MGGSEPVVDPQRRRGTSTTGPGNFHFRALGLFKTVSLAFFHFAKPSAS